MDKIYKEDIIIFGRAICTWCGSRTDLIHVEVSKVRANKKPESYDTIICKDCFKDLPDNSEREQ
jgi:hypothetical protein